MDGINIRWRELIVDNKPLSLCIANLPFQYLIVIANYRVAMYLSMPLDPCPRLHPHPHPHLYP